MANVFLNVLTPIFLVAAAGWMLARLRIVEDSRPLARISMYALLPALAFSSLARSDLRTRDLVWLGVFAWVIAGLQALLGTALCRRLSFDGATSSAVLLSVMAVNAGNYGIPLNHFAFGPAAVSTATVYYVATLLVTYGGATLLASRSVADLRSTAARLVRIPVIYAAVGGWLTNRLGLVLPESVNRPVNLLAAGAVPVMLILLGLELARARIEKDRAALSSVCALRLVIAPVLACGLAWLMDLHGVTRNVAIIQSSMPTAVGAAIVAVEFSTRPALVSCAVLVTTLSSLATLTVLLGVLGR